MSDIGSLPSSLNLAFVEGLYATYLDDSSAVPEEWRRYFASLEGDAEAPASTHQGHSQNGHGQNGHGHNGNGIHSFGPSFQPSSLFNPAANGSHINGSANASVADGPVTERAQISGGVDLEMQTVARFEAKALQDRVNQVIRAYRVRGHMAARLDPLGIPRPVPAELEAGFYGFSDADMYRLFSCETMADGQQLTLKEILDRLRNTYCRSIGVQFMHIDDLDVRDWLQDRIESTQNRLQLSREEQIRILTRLTDAVAFEEFIRRKFIGAKSFSLEGSESLIPLLDLAIEKAGDDGIEEVVMGMAHRGRLNVLANIIGKRPSVIFREFEDKDPDLHLGGGDVKYHLGYVNDWETSSGKSVRLALCFNPSHLEYVNPVAMGRLRAKGDRAGDLKRERGLCILIHGDAAFAGEGVVQETLNMSQLPGYTVGGTLHIIVNNQIGFTTGPEEARSSPYATDVAKMLQSPIFHVNGEDPEAVAQVVQLAMDFRRAWKRDVVIDMYAYRKLGHNESDEPSFTQPKLYRAIGNRQPVREGYVEHLLKLNEITREEADQIAENRRQELENELIEARSEDYRPPDKLRGAWGGYIGGPEAGVEDCDTGVPRERLKQLIEALTVLPPDFKANPKVQRLLAARAAMGRGDQPLDWSTAEALAFASLSTEPNGPVRVRFSGQDVERGTFSQRHAVLHDVEDDHRYVPLYHVGEKLGVQQAPIEIYNSPLSENGVMGFEYGYSLDCLGGLVIWEAQFGDFVNCAQVYIDQFLASAEDKWHHLSGLVLLLPHGFEGQGPEHSHARLERFMALAAEDNIQVAYPTTPAQIFHLLRRQVIRRWRKPLIVMSPKSLLRHLEAVSTLDELEKGTFQRIISDNLGRSGQDIKRVLLCSGKIYYELDKKREDLKRDDVAILRIEQLYPLAPEVLEEALSIYEDGTPVFWVQEEPLNMGAWRHMRVSLGYELFGRFPFSHITRPASASPATGSSSSHKKEQEKLLNEAFGV
jgi:2-oxoglutarate dehydrogenase E1 component